jgi:hypothetical protein
MAPTVTFFVHYFQTPDNTGINHINDFVTAPIENGFEHEEVEAGHLLKTDRLVG